MSLSAAQEGLKWVRSAVVRLGSMNMQEVAFGNRSLTINPGLLYRYAVFGVWNSVCGIVI